MIGRGLRVCEDKTHTLVLDFANNIETLGPINDAAIDQLGKPYPSGGDPPIKECPACNCHNHPVAKTCKACGHTFVFKVKLTAKASEVSITQKVAPKWLKVRSVTYARHKKKGKKDSFKISYHVGMRKFNKWLSVESDSMYAADLAAQEIPTMLKDGETIEEFTVSSLIKNKAKFKKPKQIFVDTNSKYPEILKVEYN